MIAIGIGKGERTTKWTVDRSRDDRVAARGEGVVNRLGVSGMEPDRSADARLSNGRELHTGNDASEGERDRRRLENDGMGRARI